MEDGNMNFEAIHARAILENKAFDILQPWKIYHPRTFWPMVSAVADAMQTNCLIPENYLATSGNVNIIEFQQTN